MYKFLHVNNKILVVMAFIHLNFLCITAYGGTIPTDSVNDREDIPDESATSVSNQQLVLTGEQRRIRNRFIITGYPLAMLAYGYNAWWEDRTNDFHVEYEGWFEQDAYRGGADKLGHAYTTYLSTRLLTCAFNWAGNDARQSAKLATILAGGATLAIEILDGYTEDIGFSTEDLVFDAAGIGLALLMDTNDTLDQRFDFRFHYEQSPLAQRLGENDPIEDYSGQTYLLITKASGFKGLRQHKALRYLELAVGYGSRGYKPSDGTQERERRVFYGLSINLSQLIDDTVFRNRKNSTPARQFSHGVFEYIQVPATTALAGHTL